jgi:hypothetical protein
LRHDATGNGEGYLSSLHPMLSSIILQGIVAMEKAVFVGVDREELLSRNDIDECIIEKLPMVTV